MQKGQLGPNVSQNLLSKLQKNVASIYIKRRRICQDLTDKTSQIKIFTHFDEVQKPKYERPHTDIHENLRKIIKRQSSSLVKQQQTNLILSNVKLEQTAQNTKQQKPQLVHLTINDRNKRIFGGLTNYLKKAGAHLQSKQQKEKSQSAKEIIDKVALKQKIEREDQQKLKREQLNSQIKRLQEQKRQNEERLNQAENQLLCYIVKNHFSAFGKFNLTRAEPKLFWKPNKPLEDAEKVQKIKSYGEKYLNRQQEEVLENIKSYNQVFDHGKYMTQNQRQYYANSIPNMYIDHKKFILTKTEPAIFWRPQKTNSQMQNLKRQTCTVLDEKSAWYQQKNLQFYASRENNIIQEQIEDQFGAEFQEDKHPQQLSRQQLYRQNQSKEQ